MRKPVTADSGLAEKLASLNERSLMRILKALDAFDAEEVYPALGIKVGDYEKMVQDEVDKRLA